MDRVFDPDHLYGWGHDEAARVEMDDGWGLQRESRRLAEDVLNL